jgi:hypothetical protein
MSARRRFWCSSSGRIELVFRNGDEDGAYHSGACDVDVAGLCDTPYMRKQLKAIKPGLLAKELKEYGAWDAVELADHAQNLHRLVWLASGDLVDEPDCQRYDTHEWDGDARCTHCGLWRNPVQVAI